MSSRQTRKARRLDRDYVKPTREPRLHSVALHDEKSKLIGFVAVPSGLILDVNSRPAQPTTAVFPKQVNSVLRPTKAHAARLRAIDRLARRDIDPLVAAPADVEQVAA
jgi:hypothetical protein